MAQPPDAPGTLPYAFSSALGELKLEQEKLRRHTTAHADRLRSLEERIEKVEDDNRRLRARLARNTPPRDRGPGDAAAVDDDGSRSSDSSEPDFSSPLRELQAQVRGASR